MEFSMEFFFNKNFHILIFKRTASLMTFSNYIQIRIIQDIQIHQYIQIHYIYYLQFFMGKRGLNLSCLPRIIRLCRLFFVSSVGEAGLFLFQKTIMYPSERDVVISPLLVASKMTFFIVFTSDHLSLSPFFHGEMGPFSTFF